MTKAPHAHCFLTTMDDPQVQKLAEEAEAMLEAIAARGRLLETNAAGWMVKTFVKNDWGSWAMPLPSSTQARTKVCVGTYSLPATFGGPGGSVTLVVTDIVVNSGKTWVRWHSAADPKREYVSLEKEFLDVELGKRHWEYAPPKT